MTPLDGFWLGFALAAVGCVLLIHIAGVIATRVHQRRADANVRAAFVKLANQMRETERVSRTKWDMPWRDRLLEAQCSQLVNMGLRISKPAVSS